MTITFDGSTLTFDSGSQTVPISTSLGGLGTYVTAYSTTSVTGGSTVSGSALFYQTGYALGVNTSGYSTFVLLATSSPAQTSYSLTGTWRVMMYSGYTCDTNQSQLLVRIA